MKKFATALGKGVGAAAFWIAVWFIIAKKYPAKKEKKETKIVSF